MKLRLIPAMVIPLLISLSGVAQQKQHQQLPVKLWEQEFAEGDYDGSGRMLDVAEDKSGNIYYTGYFNNPKAGTELAIVRTDKDGSVIWKRSINGDGYWANSGLRIHCDPEGYIYVFGVLFLNNKTDLVLYKFTKMGQQVWKTIIAESPYSSSIHNWPWSTFYADSYSFYVFYMTGVNTSREMKFTKIDSSGSILIQKEVDRADSSTYIDLNVFFNGKFFSFFRSSWNFIQYQNFNRLAHLDLNGELIFSKEFKSQQNVKVMGMLDTTTILSMTDTSTYDYVITSIGKYGNIVQHNNLTNPGNYTRHSLTVTDENSKNLYAIFRKKTSAEYFLAQINETLDIAWEVQLPSDIYPVSITVDTATGINILFSADSGFTIQAYSFSGSNIKTYFVSTIPSALKWLKVVRDKVVLLADPVLWQPYGSGALSDADVINVNKSTGDIAVFQYAETITSKTQYIDAKRDGEGNILTLCSNGELWKHAELILYKVSPAGKLLWRSIKSPIVEPRDLFIGWYLDSLNNTYIYYLDPDYQAYRVIFDANGREVENKQFPGVVIKHITWSDIHFSEGPNWAVACLANNETYNPFLRIMVFKKNGEVFNKTYMLYAVYEAIHYDKEIKSFQLLVRVNENVWGNYRLELWRILEDGTIIKKALLDKVDITDRSSYFFFNDGSFMIFPHPEMLAEHADGEIKLYTAVGDLYATRKLDLSAFATPQELPSFSWKWYLDKEDNFLLTAITTSSKGESDSIVVVKYAPNGKYDWIRKFKYHFLQRVNVELFVDQDNDILIYKYGLDDLRDSLIKIDENGELMWSKPMDNSGKLQNLFFENNNNYYEVYNYSELGLRSGLTAIRKYVDPSVNAISLPGPEFFYEAYPNPATRQITLSYQILNSSQVDFFIYDRTGRLIKSAYFGDTVPPVSEDIVPLSRV